MTRFLLNFPMQLIFLFGQTPFDQLFTCDKNPFTKHQNSKNMELSAHPAVEIQNTEDTDEVKGSFQKQPWSVSVVRSSCNTLQHIALLDKANVQLTILRCGEEADFSFCKRLWELSLHQVGARQDGNELPDQRGDDGGDGDIVDGGDDGEDGDGGDGGDHLGEQGGEDQPEEFVEEFQFRSPLGWLEIVRRIEKCQTLPSTTSPLST